MKEEIIKIENLTKIYENGEISVKALRDVTLTIKQGEFISVMGASGSGKSTCMNIIGCLDVPTTGEYLLSGRNVGKMNDNALAEKLSIAT